MNRVGAFRDMNHILLIDRKTYLPVKGEDNVCGLLAKLQPDRVRTWNDHAAIGKGKRTYRGYDGALHRRMDYRSARCKGIGSGAGGSGHDQAVALISGQVMAVDIGFNIGQTGKRPLVDDDI